MQAGENNRLASFIGPVGCELVVETASFWRLQNSRDFTRKLNMREKKFVNKKIIEPCISLLLVPLCAPCKS